LRLAVEEDAGVERVVVPGDFCAEQFLAGAADEDVGRGEADDARGRGIHKNEAAFVVLGENAVGKVVDDSAEEVAVPRGVRAGRERLRPSLTVVGGCRKAAAAEGEGQMRLC